MVYAVTYHLDLLTWAFYKSDESDRLIETSFTNVIQGGHSFVKVSYHIGAAECPVGFCPPPFFLVRRRGSPKLTG